MNTTLDEVVSDLKARHTLTDEAAAAIKHEMAYYACLATVDSAVRNEAVTEVHKESSKKSKAFHKQYALEHALCPKCGHDGCSSTYAGYILDMSNPDKYKNENHTVCGKCHHGCTMHERISQETWSKLNTY